MNDKQEKFDKGDLIDLLEPYFTRAQIHESDVADIERICNKVIKNFYKPIIDDRNGFEIEKIIIDVSYDEAGYVNARPSIQIKYK